MSAETCMDNFEPAPDIGYVSADAYLRNALHDLELHRSYIHEVLTGPADQYIKDNLLEAVANIEVNIWKVLL